MERKVALFPAISDLILFEGLTMLAGRFPLLLPRQLLAIRLIYVIRIPSLPVDSTQGVRCSLVFSYNKFEIPSVTGADVVMTSRLVSATRSDVV